LFAQLVIKIFNLCVHDSPSSQTDGQTTCDCNTMLCTIVHCTVKNGHKWYQTVSHVNHNISFIFQFFHFCVVSVPVNGNITVSQAQAHDVTKNRI